MRAKFSYSTPGRAKISYSSPGRASLIQKQANVFAFNLLPRALTRGTLIVECSHVELVYNYYIIINFIVHTTVGGYVLKLSSLASLACYLLPDCARFNGIQIQIQIQILFKVPTLGVASLVRLTRL